MKILLIGATGQLGGDLARNNPGHEIVAPEPVKVAGRDSPAGSAPLAMLSVPPCL